MSHRLEKVKELIKRELALLLLREVSFPKDVLVTLTRVECPKDLTEAKVFISILPENQSKKILEILNIRGYDLQEKLNKRLVMRKIPKIKFFEEKEVKEAARIEELLEKIKRDKAR